MRHRRRLVEQRLRARVGRTAGVHPHRGRRRRAAEQPAEEIRGAKRRIHIADERRAPLRHRGRRRAARIDRHVHQEAGLLVGVDLLLERHPAGQRRAGVVAGLGHRAAAHWLGGHVVAQRGAVARVQRLQVEDAEHRLARARRMHGEVVQPLRAGAGLETGDALAIHTRRPAHALDTGVVALDAQAGDELGKGLAAQALVLGVDEGAGGAQQRHIGVHARLQPAHVLFHRAQHRSLLARIGRTLGQHGGRERQPQRGQQHQPGLQQPGRPGAGPGVRRADGRSGGRRDGSRGRGRQGRRRAGG